MSAGIEFSDAPLPERLRTSAADVAGAPHFHRDLTIARLNEAAAEIERLRALVHPLPDGPPWAPERRLVVGTMCHCDDPDDCYDHWEFYLVPSGQIVDADGYVGRGGRLTEADMRWITAALGASQAPAEPAPEDPIGDMLASIGDAQVVAWFCPDRNNERHKAIEVEKGLHVTVEWVEGDDRSLTPTCLDCGRTGPTHRPAPLLVEEPETPDERPERSEEYERWRNSIGLTRTPDEPEGAV